MGKRTSHAPGTFSWVDLGTSDVAAAKTFYGGLLGWELEDVPAGAAGTYTMARVAGAAVCGMYERSADRGPPAWLSYITVASTVQTAVRAGELGGTIVAPTLDVFDAGRMALLADPAGAVFAIWEPLGSIGAELVNDAGALCLNQLNTNDPETARSYYSELFGWTVEHNHAGSGEYWGLYNDGTLSGAVMRLPANAQAPPHWLAYFTVSDLDGSVNEITNLGGGIFVDPMTIQSGRIAVARDPGGAVFALFEGEVDP